MGDALGGVDGLTATDELAITDPLADPLAIGAAEHPAMIKANPIATTMGNDTREDKPVMASASTSHCQGCRPARTDQGSAQ